MVAIINASKSLRNALHYNENKLKQRAATLIHSRNYVKDTEHLGFTDKLATLERLTNLNKATKVNCVHISLNFDPSENLDKKVLQKIADTYLQKTGFGDQPYLVYQHHDAGHPHIHLVTTNIQRDGSRIKLHNIGRNQSEKARKEIEKEFNLIKAEKPHLKHTYELRPLAVQKIQYGKSQSKRAITNVLEAILPTYKYTSLAELNALLKEYNVLADRGSEGSRTYQKNGLVYRILDDKGQKIGVPIKASDIYNKPGLKYLKHKFEANGPLRQAHKQHVRNSVDYAMAKFPVQSFNDLGNILKKEGIHLVLRQNNQGLVYGITYVDHTTKCVFNGSDLGKNYSANRMRVRCDPYQIVINNIKQSQTQTLQQVPSHTQKLQQESSHTLSGATGDTITTILQPEETDQFIAKELRNEELRKRKRKRLHH